MRTGAAFRDCPGARPSPAGAPKVVSRAAMDALPQPSSLEAKKRRLLALLLAEEGIDPQQAPIRPLPRTAAGTAGAPDAFPLSFAQERLWLIDRLEPGSAAYNLP